MKERKQLIQKTFNIEQMLTSIIEHSNEIFYLHDTHHKLIYASPQSLQILGYTPSEMMTEWIRLVTDNPINKIGYEITEKALATGQRQKPYLLEVFKKDGRKVLLEIEESPLKDEEGKVSGIIGAARDVTERKRVEETLRENEARLRKLSDNLPNGLVYQIDSGDDGRQRRFSYISAGVEQLHGITVREALNNAMSIYGQIIAEDRLRLAEEEAVAVANMVPFRTEARVQLPSGEIQWRFFTSAPRRLPNNHLIWDGVEIDITERKRAEKALREINETLEQRVAERTVVLNGINRIFRTALTAVTEEELGRACLAIVEEVTQSRFGFIGEIGPDGLLHDIAISDFGWDLCTMYDKKTGHRRPPGNFKLHGLYGRVLTDGKAFYTNEPSSHPDSIGTPEGHPPLKAFLGAPLLHGGQTIGMIALGNREGGYRQEDLEMLEAITPTFVEALLRFRAEEKLRERERDLEIQTNNLEEINTALNVLLKKRDEDKTELEEKVLQNVQQLIEPYIAKLKLSGLDERQKALASILESNLKDMTSSFAYSLSSKHLNLTPKEIKVANLIKQGMTSKEICDILGSSEKVVAFHRQNIRRKLGLLNKKVNLKSYLEAKA